MKKTNKFLSCLLCLTMAFGVSLTACKDGGEDSSSSVSSSEESKTAVSLNETALTVEEDADFYLEATTNGGAVTWTTSDKTVASVSANGRVLAKKQGTVTITATAGDASASCTVTVVKSDKPEGAAIKTNASTYFFSMADKNTEKIQPAYVIDDGGAETEQAGKTFTFESMDENVATVAQDGTVTPVALGTTEIVVTCEGLTVFVTADVYTDGIATPMEWLNAIKNSCSIPDKPETDERYYLENDIDFEGVEYDIGAVAKGANSDKGNPYHFGSEINGNFHTVKNITQWKEDGELNPDAHQSIFGRTIGATVKNIGFENVVFTSSRSYGLCAVMMHHSSLGQMKNNTFTNVRAEFLYGYEPVGGVKGHMATGVTGAAYGAVLNGVFVRMRSTDGTNLKELYDNVYGFAQAEWVWYGGSLTDVITFVEDVPEGEADFINEAAGDQNYFHAKNDCYAVSTKMQAAYYAQLVLDGDVWDFYPDNVPTFKK